MCMVCDARTREQESLSWLRGCAQTHQSTALSPVRQSLNLIAQDGSVHTKANVGLHRIWFSATPKTLRILHNALCLNDAAFRLWSMNSTNFLCLWVIHVFRDKNRNQDKCFVLVSFPQTSVKVVSWMSSENGTRRIQKTYALRVSLGRYLSRV